MLLLVAWVAGLAGGTGFMMQEAGACTRILYVGDRNMVATGRNMDWNEDMMWTGGAEFTRLAVPLW